MRPNEFDAWIERMTEDDWDIWTLEEKNGVCLYKLLKKVGNGIPAYDISVLYALWMPGAITPAWVGEDYMTGYKLWERRNGPTNL